MAFFLALNLLFWNFGFALAFSENCYGVEGGSVCIPEPLSVVDDVLTKFNVSSDSIANSAQIFNVTDQKTTFPQVSLYFNPTDIKVGQKLTAQAFPMYFSNTEEKLYFTWYLKHDRDADGKHGWEECETKSYDENCDWDGENGIDEEDWKIEAMRIIAQNGYSKEDEPKPDYGNDNDGDGYFAPLGGGDKIKNEDDNESRPAYCYIGDFSSGTKYKLGQTSDTESVADYELNCPSGTSPYCLKTSSDSCLGLAITEANEECELVNTSMVPKCEMADGTEGTPKCIDDSITSNSNLFSSGFFKYRRLFDGGDPAGIPNSCLYGDKKCFDTTADDQCFSTSYDYDTGADSISKGSFTCDEDNVTYNDQYLIDDWEDYMTGRGLNLSGFGCSSYARDYEQMTDPTCTLIGKEYDGKGCEHLFPDTGNDNWEAGDGDFGGGEERFWGTNPQDANTAGNGNLDEANVSGLGQKEFSWIYQTGDKVGVIVEGTSLIPTKYEDGSYAVMWALPKNVFFGKDNNPDSNKIGSETGYAKGYAFSVSSYSENPINHSLEYNLVDPAEKMEQKLDISLDFTPENPVNDSSGNESGDVLSINSIINGTTQDNSFLDYSWKIEAKKKNGGYVDISDQLVDDGLITKLEGLGLSTINISLNLGDKYKDYFSDDVGSLKITNTIKESTLGKIRMGKGEAIVAVNSTNKRINAYLTSSNDGSSLVQGDAICNKDESSANSNFSFYVCPVIKNQILKLEIDNSDHKMSDFAWSVNNIPVSCGNPVSGDCSGGNMMYLPIAGSTGDMLNVKVIAKNMDNGKNIEISKSFQIVDPYIKIISEDEKTFWPRFLGTYSNLDGQQYTDVSNSVFETYPGASVSLSAEFHPLSLDKFVENTESGNIQWNIDGEESSTQKEADFKVEKNEGDSYNINLSAYYHVPNEIRKVLKDKWNISQTDSSGQVLSASIEGNVVSEDAAGVTAFSGPKKVLASLISNLPGQVTFLLRIALTIFVVIMISGIAFNSQSGFLKKNKNIYE